MSIENINIKPFFRVSQSKQFNTNVGNDNGMNGKFNFNHVIDEYVESGISGLSTSGATIGEYTISNTGLWSISVGFQYPSYEQTTKHIHFAIVLNRNNVHTEVCISGINLCSSEYRCVVLKLQKYDKIYIRSRTAEQIVWKGIYQDYNILSYFQGHMISSEETPFFRISKHGQHHTNYGKNNDNGRIKFNKVIDEYRSDNISGLGTNNNQGKYQIKDAGLWHISCAIVFRRSNNNITRFTPFAISLIRNGVTSDLVLSGAQLSSSEFRSIVIELEEDDILYIRNWTVNDLHWIGTIVNDSGVYTFTHFQGYRINSNSVPYFRATKELNNNPNEIFTNSGSTVRNGKFEFNKILAEDTGTGPSGLKTGHVNERGRYIINDPGLWSISCGFYYPLSVSPERGAAFAITLIRDNIHNDMAVAGFRVGTSEFREIIIELKENDILYVRNWINRTLDWKAPYSYFQGYRISNYTHYSVDVEIEEESVEIEEESDTVKFELASSINSLTDIEVSNNRITRNQATKSIIQKTIKIMNQKNISLTTNLGSRKKIIFKRKDLYVPDTIVNEEIILMDDVSDLDVDISTNTIINMNEIPLTSAFYCMLNITGSIVTINTLENTSLVIEKFEGYYNYTYDGVVNTLYEEDVIDQDGVFIVLGSVIGTSNIVTSNICFFKDSIVKTDQGYFPIQNLEFETIDNLRFIRTKTKYLSDFLVVFEKDSLGPNLPNKTLITTPDHKIFIKKMKKAIDYVNNDTIYKKKYKDQYVYNLLFEKHKIIVVNGICCESLDPKNSIRNLYTKESTIIDITRYNQKMKNILCR